MTKRLSQFISDSVRTSGSLLLILDLGEIPSIMRTSRSCCCIRMAVDDPTEHSRRDRNERDMKSARKEVRRSTTQSKSVALCLTKD
jgi:hypothetical protein